MVKRALSYFLILSLLFFIVGCGNSSSNNSSTNATDSSSESDDSATEVNPDTGETELTEDFTVGSTYTVDNISATLNKVTTSTEIDSSTPADGNIYLVCNWTVENNGTEDFSPLDFSTTATVDETSVQDVITSLPDQFDMETIITPGSSTTGDLVYEVPENWSEFQTSVQIGGVGGESKIFKVVPDQLS